MTASPDDIASLFEIDIARVAPFDPRRNLAPTDPFVTVIKADDGARSAVTMRWGIRPPKAVRGTGFFNARAETVTTNGLFRSSFEKRRCLLVADGFYEWATEGKKKIPRLFTVGRGSFAMAGIYRKNATASGLVELGCAALTRAAVGVVARIHDRMPVILRMTDLDAWLAPHTAEHELLDIITRSVTDLDVDVLDKVPVDTPPKQLRMF